MKCIYCNEEIFSISAFEEILKFQKHLENCEKNPNKQMIVNKSGKIIEQNCPVSLYKSLELRP